MARKKRGATVEVPGLPKWIPLYICLIIILVAFFICLNAFALQDQNAVKQALGSLRGSFGVLSGGYIPYTSGKNATSENWDTHKVAFTTVNMQVDINAVENFIASINNAIDFMGISDMNIEKEVQQIRLRIPGKILFKSGNWVISEEAYSLLDKIVSEISKFPYPISVEGHTDGSTTNESQISFNWTLSIKRAVKITEYFESKGIPNERMRAIGYSMFQPLDDILIDFDKSLNNRVEILILFKSKENEDEFIKKTKVDKSDSFQVNVDYK